MSAAKNVIPAEALRCAPLLERMIEIVGAQGHEHVNFGDALTQAERETGIIAGGMADTLLVTVFKTVATGRLFRGAAEA